LPAIKEVAGRIQSVFSLGVISVLPGGGHAPVLERIKRLGFKVRPNGKVNLGLGRPIPDDSPPSPEKQSRGSERRPS